MAGPSRVMPALGMRAIVQHLALEVEAVVCSVDDEGRRVVVVTDEGEEISFTLSRATGRFQAPGSGPRLRLCP